MKNNTSAIPHERRSIDIFLIFAYAFLPSSIPATIDAKLSSITGVDTANALDPEEIQFEVTGVAADAKLAADGTHTVQVKVTWVSNETDTMPTATSKRATITLNYVQDTAQ